jgi:putative lipoic acid-binding regulatory protein
MQHQAADFSRRVIAEVSRADPSEVVYQMRLRESDFGTFATARAQVE